MKFKDQVSLFFLQILILLLNCNCENRNNNAKDNTSSVQDTDSIPIFNPVIGNKKEFDSIKYFKDIDFTSLKGKDEINEKSISYPYCITAYRKNIIDLFLVVSRDSILKREYVQEDHMVSHSYSRYDNHGGDTGYHRFIYKEKSNFLLFIADTSKRVIDGLLVPNALIFYKAINDSTFEQEFFGSHGNIKGDLDDLLGKDLNQLDKIYGSHQIKRFTLKKDKIKVTTSILKDEHNDLNVNSKDLEFNETDFKSINYYFFYKFY